jgi:hypothetical protein
MVAGRRSPVLDAFFVVQGRFYDYVVPGVSCFGDCPNGEGSSLPYPGRSKEKALNVRALRAAVAVLVTVLVVAWTGAGCGTGDGTGSNVPQDIVFGPNGDIVDSSSEAGPSETLGEFPQEVMEDVPGDAVVSDLELVGDWTDDGQHDLEDLDNLDQMADRRDNETYEELMDLADEIAEDPKVVWLCRPCTATTQCSELLPDNGAVCVAGISGDVRSFCGSECSTDLDCPQGFACGDRESVEELPVRQCLPISGECHCQAKFVEVQAATWCERANQHGRCSGWYTCSVQLTGECSALVPQPEHCNGIDDNCNGETDEGEAVGCTDYYEDEDGDGWGTILARCLCAPDPPFSALKPGDCAPGDPMIPTCLGKDCGGDGCGGSCGTCSSGKECVDGVCRCVPQCQNPCGADGCGGFCGFCPDGFLCVGGQCVCQPDCAGKECGTDGCGGNCGDCPTGIGCQAGICVCQPACGGRECGPDGCGGSCGACPPGWPCMPITGKCFCFADCAGRLCGDNGCGGSCGTCELPEVCEDGHCVCHPNCAGKNCGPDGCGGTCGDCQPTYTCSAAGVCLPPNPCAATTFAGECVNWWTYSRCHEPGNYNLPCQDPPFCALTQQDCDLQCWIEWGYSYCGQCGAGGCSCYYCDY